MGFWVFMLCCNLLIPVLMILFGRYYMSNPPMEINGLIGYRTRRSMANKETWDFAHRYWGRLFFKFGLFLLVVSPVAMLPCIGWDVDSVGIYGGMVELVQGVVMLLPIFFTEKALKRKFG